MFCYISRLSLQQQQKITGANQNSRPGTYNNTNLILKTTEWMIYKVFSLYYLHHFPPLAAVSLPGWLLKSLLLSLRFRVCVVVFIHEKENWQRFPPPLLSRNCHATFHHALITCCNVPWAGPEWRSRGQESTNGSPCLVEWKSRKITNRGYYMAAQRRQISFRVLKNISHVSAPFELF